MNVYFVRHGESEGNVASVHQSGKTKLTANGLKQAAMMAQRFSKITVDVIFSSDYDRAAKTAEQISLVTEKPVIHTPLLREVKRPSELEGKSHYDPAIKKLKKLLDEHANDPAWHYSDEENMHDLINRAQQSLDFIAARKEENIVVVSHGVFLRLLVSTMMYGTQAPLSFYEAFIKFTKHQNTGITFCRNIDGNWKLISWNDHAHLG